MKNIEYILKVIDRDTKIVVQTETRKSIDAFDRLWQKAIKNVNGLKYHLEASERKI